MNEWFPWTIVGLMILVIGAQIIRSYIKVYCNKDRMTGRQKERKRENDGG